MSGLNTWIKHHLHPWSLLDLSMGGPVLVWDHRLMNSWSFGADGGGVVLQGLNRRQSCGAAPLRLSSQRPVQTLLTSPTQVGTGSCKP